MHRGKADLLVQRNEPVNATQYVPVKVVDGAQSQDQHNAAIVYAARGWSNIKIAEVLCVHPDTISHWRTEPWWQPNLQKALDRILREPTEAFGCRVPDALQTLDMLVALKDKPEVQMRAVSEVFDRAFGKAPVRGAEHAGVVVNIVFAPNPTDGPNPHITYDSAEVVDSEAHVIEDV